MLKFFFLLLAILFNIASADDYLFTFCSNSKNYTRNSTFENNLKQLLVSLPSNTSVTGFYNTSIGDHSSDQVYTQALCRGDVNSTICQACIEKAGQHILEQCKREDAIIWYELCQVRYSFQRFFSSMIYAGKYIDLNDNNEEIISDRVRFREVMLFLMNSLSYEAAYDPSKRMFVTGEVKYSSKETIYGLVQCTRDISNSSCDNCLKSAIGDLKACCSSRNRGIIVSRNCNVRFDLNLFYNASSSLLAYPTSKDDQKIELALLHDIASPTRVAITQEGELVSSVEPFFMDLATIRSATDEFSDSNKLGKGGFGTVYKGVLPEGKEVAVKRLSRKSWQGLEEFKNEVILIAKLQHRNLVKLLGCGIEGEEKLLVYEVLQFTFTHDSMNLDISIEFSDSERRSQLDWKTCYNIIGGIAKGLLYLHEDSRLKIIHRDLKPSNVLLDQEMVAKISDFGMARIFCENQNMANTKRVVGTYGYMAPEYAMEGVFSVKSDVFSFGVILLEIISGKRNSGFYRTEHAQTLLAYAWRLWCEGKVLEFVDCILMESCWTSEIVRCIHIGLLCVQEDPEDRPNMSSVVTLLGSESIALPEPKHPAFAVARFIQIDEFLETIPSINDLSLSSISPQ
uniref:non-specific serine/threonine protein kinase n=1 Tax=Fagus sylvatica TaxID=28930 RepID=A0A2N9J0N4_FAGSY